MKSAVGDFQTEKQKKHVKKLECLYFVFKWTYLLYDDYFFSCGCLASCCSLLIVEALLRSKPANSTSKRTREKEGKTDWMSGEERAVNGGGGRGGKVTSQELNFQSKTTVVKP